MPVIPMLGRQKQEDCQRSKANLSPLTKEVNPEGTYMLQTLLPSPSHKPTTNQPPYAQCRDHFLLTPLAISPIQPMATKVSELPAESVPQNIQSQNH